MIKHVNGGDAILFIEGFQVAYIFNAGNFESRNIEQPENEHVVKGPKEAFIEKASSNISLIRKKIKNENLIVESMSISKRANNEVFMLYVNDLANDKLVDNIKKRLDSLDVDMIQNLSLLEQYIDERSYSVFPTILYTERPDRAASFIADGFIVLIMDNSPDCLILPATFWSFYHNAEDYYLRLPYGNFTRFLRGLALLITLLTSAIYIALTTFHAGMIPPDLLFAIVSARFKVPLTVFAEIILMEIAFELIREAGLRVPTPIGPTIGIVGALILGQAAVQANVVSPVVVIVVALGGLCSFVIGDYSLNYAFRISRFACICAAYLFGFYGIMAVFVMGLTYLSSLKSFGVPYLSPLTPSYIPSKNTIFRTILSKDRFRPGFIKPKDTQKKTGD
ncbi:spore germination protein [Paracerasibacillus soli]|uniref:Spore germination protein n=1 Tax=Paracerasibacillus soli TaxID=480284 RepID=A0ABU5CNV8_9BACI|nr:spore germination protein [Virgibacillus soli]MDY0408031.1 spore germination protein [Virgibacillus soli]